MSSVTISSRVLDAIRAHAASSPAVEVCGLLFGDSATITYMERCANVAADPAFRFELDPAALFAAHRRARTDGPQIVGHYHSHPTGVAKPSTRDAADAVPDGTLWLLVAGREVTAWRAVEFGAVMDRFDPVALRMSPCAPLPASPQDAATTRGTR